MIPKAMRQAIGKLAALVLLLLGLFPAGAASAETLSGLARFVPDGAGARATTDGAEIILGLSQPVPYRLVLLDDPPRLAVELRTVDWGGADLSAFRAEGAVSGATTESATQEGSRIVFSLARPMVVEAAEMVRTGNAGARATLRLRLRDAPPEVFASMAARASGTEPPSGRADPPRRRQDGTRPLVVVIDPGHGGFDPGAEVEGVREADVVLRFARELRAAIRRRLGARVVLTRDDDAFVPLPVRLSRARAAGADLFISVHADTVARGRATGATVYTLSEDATDEATRILAERQDRADILAGVDLSATDDTVAAALMDMARRETMPRSERLARHIVEGIETSVGRLYKHPRMTAGFSVLRAPDIPSVLLEIGFLSDPRDRRNILDPAWRARLADGLAAAIERWALEDAAAAALLRR
ncbi:MAG: N-acetylmuramoyl-L-alanine amidase [Alphaproteobacteria bacterium]|nr:MAG: N-acetylmuramoyl-L-alanine amidase [Alphaproteobacteria bacterium]